MTPQEPLDPRSTYLVTVRGVKDRAGNRRDQKPTKALRYGFETA